LDIGYTHSGDRMSKKKVTESYDGQFRHVIIEDKKHITFQTWNWNPKTKTYDIKIKEKTYSK